MAGWKDRRTMPESVDPGFKPVATGWKTGIEKPPVKGSKGQCESWRERRREDIVTPAIVQARIGEAARAQLEQPGAAATAGWGIS